MKKYDLIVVGGGITGVAAAVSAARLDLSVLLIEKCGALGGAMIQSLVFPYMRYTANKGEKLLSDGIFTEMRQRKEKYDDTSWETYRFVFDDMVTEAGVDVLFHATVFDVSYDGRKIKSVSVTSRAKTFEFCADYFIDASGDGDLMALAKCDFQLGRETDEFCQPMTTCFRLGNVDVEEFKKEKPQIQELYKQFQSDGKIKNPRENILTFTGLGEGIVHFNTTRVIKLSPVDFLDIGKAEMTARKQIYEMYEFLKANFKSFKNATIISVANQIGIRESRKLKGKHILTAEELINMTKFSDTIALGNYEIDIHNPTGTGTYHHRFSDSDYYGIPYSSLLPNEYDNMLVAGRCLSATHEAQAAVRIMPICAALGQAAGSAAAIAKETGTNMHTLDIKRLQKVLTQNGAAIE